ncbi:hypothetical protein DL240_19015 [Lujinxingia litoralis]|uniref:Uncharacterized protein n=1 Tax=Lujinxingia litoralis TaxID=2211119 RepID=A0A328C2B2_9DELT|nr:hypothetical protein [Lujinxingia litoralis]RAL20055.1 hypothetical protein DL240_19015 [Lujinxingia litoralis]
MARSKDRIYDIRTLDRFLREGKITDEDYQAHLDQLPDASEKAATVEAVFEENVLEKDAE